MLAENRITTEAGTDEKSGSRSSPTPEEVARLFPQLEVLQCLGRGGMGVVYKARQPRLDRVVALKILSPEKENDPRFAARFEREARALARLHHPNIVTLYDFGEVEGRFYLLMEFVNGVTLRDLYHARKLSTAEALDIVQYICDALQYARQQNIVHCDIKPENILLDKNGTVKIADFGIARMVGPGTGALPGDENVVGTPQYMSPEQREKPQAVDYRSDIFSLGVVFYEMLTGELPGKEFQLPSRKVSVDVRLDEIVLRALEREPERRYQNVGQIKTDLQTVATGMAPDIGRARPVAWLIVMSLAVAAGIAAVFLKTTKSSPPDSTTGLVARWHADGDARDGVARHDGALLGGATFAGGIQGQAFDLRNDAAVVPQAWDKMETRKALPPALDDGAYVEVPSSRDWAFGTNDFTIELWASFRSMPIYDMGHSQGGVFISATEGPNDVNKWWFAYGGHVLNVLIDSPDHGPVWLVRAPFKPVLNQWYHFALTRHGQMFAIYVNGTVVGSEESGREMPSVDAPLTIGESEGFFFNGRLDEVGIYRRALSEREITAIYKEHR
ncbi:MAG TPA: protein kinase [Desulfuromonadaceae bacterium]|nr:protein kinase [Desulfuromonadaceae bacterium]